MRRRRRAGADGSGAAAHLPQGDDPHDYKYSSAVLEDYFAVSPEWRDRFLSAAMFQLRGSGDAVTTLAVRLKRSG